MKKNHLITILLTAIALFAALSCSRQAHVLWQRRFDTGNADFGSSVATDGRDIVVGTTRRDTLTVRQHTGWQLLRYDQSGNLAWQHAFDRGRFDSLADIAVAADHDIIALGHTGYGTALDPTRLLLARFSAKGDVKWQKEYQFGSITKGVAVRLDTIGRIWVCGSVATASDRASDLLVARFDSLGNLLDSVTVDFGADETGQDLLLVPSRVGALVFVAGLRTPLPGKPDTLKTGSIAVVRLDPDLHEMWRWVYHWAGDGLSGQLSWQGAVCLAVTLRKDSGVATHLVEHSSGDAGYYPQTNQEADYAGASNANCAGLVRDRSGAILGVGAYGPNGQQRCLGWRYFRGKFTDFLSGSKYAAGANDRADALALDADGNLVVSGVSETGGKASILLLKLALPRHKPPPDLWLPNMYR